MPAHDDNVTHDEMANAIRALAMDAVERAKSGHPGLPMGAADIATVLFTKVRKYDAAAASWAVRDRFVLSAGRGSMLFYALRRTKHDYRGTATLPSARLADTGPSRIPPCAGGGGHNGSARPGACLAGRDGACRTHAECGVRATRRLSYLCPRLRWRSHGGHQPGRDHRRSWDFHRHDRVWRKRALQGCLQLFQHYARSLRCGVATVDAC
jgi:hypothetical protein